MKYLTVSELRKILNEVADVPSKELVLEFLNQFKDTDLLQQINYEGPKRRC